MSPRRSVTIVSPHYDDVPLSLGQSLRDGVLSSCAVRVRIVFGRTNWTNWAHPTPSRANAVSAWRRLEETVAARSFGYRWTAAGWEEALLRWGGIDNDRLLDPTADLSGEPMLGELAAWLRDVAAPPDGAGSRRPELLLVPAGLGGHVDHRLVALAAASVSAELPCAVGFYEDRPYVAHLAPDELAVQLDALAQGLDPVDLSGPVTAGTQRRVRRAYPSQMDDYFREAMRRDLDRGAVERAWFPVGTVPDWLR